MSWTLLTLAMLACGDKVQDTGVVEAQPASEPNSNIDTEDTDTDTDTDTDIDTDTQEPNFDVVSIEEIQTGVIEKGQTVRLENVIISSPMNEYGFYVSHPDGGSYSGLFVYYAFEQPVNLSVEQGNVLSIVGEVMEYPDTCADFADNDEDGLIDEEDPDCQEEGGVEEVMDTYHTLTELKLLDPGNVELIDENGPGIAITILDPAVLADPITAEEYEGSLIRLEGGTVTSGQNHYNEWTLDDIIIDDLWGVDPGLINIGDGFTAVQGIFHFSSGNYKIEPRSNDDIIGWNRTCEGDRCIWDLSEGELLITEFMANPDNDGTCSDSDGEYIEVTYPADATAGSVDLRGMLLSDESTTITISQSIILTPGELIWISVGEQNCYGSATVQIGPSSFSLNNSGDVIRLHHTDIDGSNLPIDSLTYTSDQVTQGASTQLSSDKFNLADSNTMINWCTSNVQIDGTSDFGSPGEANGLCQ